MHYIIKKGIKVTPICEVKPSGGTFANINRPTAGPTHEKVIERAPFDTFIRIKLS